MYARVETRIAALTISKRSCSQNGNVEATIRIDDNTATGRVTARIIDVNDRVLTQTTGLTPKNGQVTVVLPLNRVREQYNVLQVDLVVDDKVMDTASDWFCVPQPWEKDLFVFSDDGGRNLYGARRRAIFREYGVTTCEIGSDASQLDPTPVLASGLRISTRLWTTHCNQYTGGCISSRTYPAELSANFESVARSCIPYGLTFFSVGDDSGTGADFCNSYPNWIRSYIRGLSVRYNGDFQAFWKDHAPKGVARRWGAWRYMAWQGNLAEITDLRHSPEDLELMRDCWRANYGTVQEFNRASGTSFTSFDAVTLEDLTKIKQVNPCLLGFRDSMRERYGKITALNQAWGTDLKDFEEITNPVIEGLVPQGKYGAKLDKIWYLEDLFIRNMSAAAAGVRRVSSDVGIGMGAATLPNIIPDVLEHIDSVMPYKGERDIEVIRSFPHRYCGQTIGVYGGKKVTATARENQAWETVFTGGNFIWFWSMCTGGLMGDLSVNPGRSGVMLENIKEMQGGIARALIQGDRLHDGIGILHSRRSGGLSKFVKDLGATYSSQVGFQHIIEDLGLQYRYTSSKEIENRSLRTDEFKVLILPYSQVLTDAEVKELERFVKRGGTILADLRPGTHDIHGRPLAAGALDKLFGITQNCAEPKPVKGEMPCVGPKSTAAADVVRVPGIRGDASVRVVDALAWTAVDKTPMILIKRNGKGQAILLNHAPTTYDVLLNRGQADALRDLYRALFSRAGVERRFRVVDGDGNDVAGAEIAVFRNGSVEYLTIEKKAYEFETYPINAFIEFDHMRDVYNCRTGKRIGMVRRAPVTLTGLGCYVFSMLPYETTELKVWTPATVKLGMDVTVAATVVVENGTCGRHTIRFDVFRPDGARLWPMVKMETTKGKAWMVLPLAYNDQAGAWKIVVTDVTTGRTLTRPIAVQ